MGGIQTFFLRLAKKRFSSNLNTTFLICNDKIENEIYSELKEYSKIIFYSELFYCFPFQKNRAFLSTPIRKNNVLELLKSISSIHTSHGLYALLAHKMILTAKKNISITVGFYHSRTHSTGLYSKYYFEQINSDFILKYLPKKNLFLFSRDIEIYYKNTHNINLNGSHHFRLGVIDYSENETISKLESSNVLKICSVGRLVDFKTYNIQMIFVIKKLVKEGIDIQYHIYGDGPEYNEIFNIIQQNKLELNVHLCGVIPYEYFDEKVSKYDFFVGSGTALIQASSLGIPSIVGIESYEKSETYGFFSDIYDREYNIQELEIEKQPIEKVIKKYLSMSCNEKADLCTQHMKASKFFDNLKSSELFNEATKESAYIGEYKFSKVRYDISRIVKSIF
jgi:hypothetical protein